MLDWILEKLPVIIFVLVFLGQIVRGFMRSRDAQAEQEPQHNELEQERRAREVQEEIRRKIAARRAGRAQRPGAGREVAAEESVEPPVIVRREDPTALPVPEPLKRMLQELERKVQPAPAPAPAPMAAPAVERRAAEWERQQQLAEQMRELEEAKAVAQRRAANIAAATLEASRSEGALRTAARGRLLDDLRDPESLRRAFVLREVLGTPVGLR